MPIKPENKSRYPADWKAISMRIRTRAGHCCEFCGLKNRAVGFRDVETGEFFSAEEFAEGNERIESANFGDRERPITIVLTVAHLDHQPENCSEDNLKALCQRCHNIYDAEHRKQTRSQTRSKKLGVANLFQEKE